MPAKPMQKESRDRNLARAMLMLMTRRDVEAGTRPIRVSFAPGGCDALGMDEICKKGGWEPQRGIYQARVLHAIARNLHESGVLRRWTPRIGSKTYSYSLATEWLKRLAPSKWGDLSCERGETSTPDREMEMLLDLVYPVGGSPQDPVLLCESQTQTRDSVPRMRVAHQPNHIQAQ